MKSSWDTILRLVRDMLRFRLRESLGGGLRVRLAWLPRNQSDSVPSPCPSPGLPTQAYNGLWECHGSDARG